MPPKIAAPKLKPGKHLADELKRRNSGTLLNQARAVIVDRAAGKDQARANDGLIHGSEVAAADWCATRAYFRLTEQYDITTDKSYWRRISVFEEGEHAHRRWQAALKDVREDAEGNQVFLFGDWHCLACSHRVYDSIPPDSCANCGALPGAIIYDEVRVTIDGLPFIGHGDAEVRVVNRSMEEHAEGVEVKTLGVGTVRWYAPHLIPKHTCECGVLDMPKLWRNVTSPFPSHIRQSMLYGHLRGWEKVHIWYDSKVDQASKDFILGVDHDVVGPMVQDIEDTAESIAAGVPPARPDWATSPSAPGCAECPALKLCWPRGRSRTRSTTDGDATTRPPGQPGDPGGGGARRRVVVRRRP